MLGYKADISNAWDYYPFGMYMPGRYISDTGSKCVTINTTVLVPVTTKVWVGPAIGQGPWVIAWPWGHPDIIPVHQLTPASSFALEKLYLYHYLPAQEHPGGWVVNATAQGDGTAYEINLGNEPSGVSAFLMLHPPSGSSMDIGFDMNVSEDYQAQVRVRQYLGSGSEYEEALGWTPVQMGGQQQYNIQLNQAAIAAGGKTLMELRFTKLDGGTFAQNVVAQVWSPWKYVTSYVPESRVARVCDGKENYRYGFNGMEKDNETKGPGNSLDYGARMFDSRLGRFLSVDAAVAEMPWQAPYQFASNSPIYRLDPDGNWDVTVHAYKDRAKSGYALLVVTDNKGMEVYRTVVKTIGTGGRIRNVKNSDSPQGEYGILGWRKTGSGTNYNRISFGPNNLLALNYKGEEGGSRNGIHVHGGRQEGPKYKDRKDLASTHGCLRINDNDIKDIKEIATQLEKNDPTEKAGKLILRDDLKNPVKYNSDRHNAGLAEFPKEKADSEDDDSDNRTETKKIKVMPYDVQTSPVDNTYVKSPVVLPQN